MTDFSHGDADSLSPEQLARIDEICDQFELVWQYDQPPSIRQAVGSAEPPLRRELFRNLLGLDVFLRRQHGDRVCHQDYVSEFGEYDLIIREVFCDAETISDADETQTSPQPRSTAGESEDEQWPLGELIGRHLVLERVGKGGFGSVYLAQDTELDRNVAVKIAHGAKPAGHVDMQLLEARVAARLDHPHIVRIYDVGRLLDGRLFIVSEYVNGSDLKSRMEFGYQPRQAAELIAHIGAALHHAHQHRIFHRDVKPANILIDQDHQPYLTDFGLALREEQVGTGPVFVGSPPYMSPEQARQEGHLVDARSDVFSLSVVLYELLTGRRPFQGETRDEILQAICDAWPLAPTTLNPDIPAELQRITLKGLSRRAGDRYQTAAEMVGELRDWLEDRVLARQADPAPENVVPKGARSFDESDAHFFQRLVPGPRTQRGVPEAIDYWLSRIEARAAAKTFRVGVLYGPSGSGKSSFIQAGVLPELKTWIRTISVTATPDSTEKDCLHELRKKLPALARAEDLIDAMRKVRGGHIVSGDEKVLIVVDQFEQYLSGRNQFDNSDLVAALRQCDGAHVQTLLVVRDDYWYGLSKCLKAADVQLDQSNSRLSELFEEDHAKSVLLEFGRGYGRVDDRRPAADGDAKTFADKAINDMRAEGQIVPVRLALFADVFKSRDWTASELARVGGVDGVVSLFLDEIIEGDAAHPVLKREPQATEKLLRALLPPSRLRIKERPRTIVELTDLAGLKHTTTAADVLDVLDTEYRLVSSIAPDEGESPAKRYQLAHDYLVPIVRQWAARRQRDTFRGRAENLLVDRAASWRISQDNRNLPSALEWLMILGFVRRRHWSRAAHRMMRTANRYYLTSIGILLLLLLCTVAGVTIMTSWNSTLQSVGQLATADIEQVPPLLNMLRARPRFASAAATKYLENKSDNADPNRWALSLLSLSQAPDDLAKEIVDAVRQATPRELMIIRDEMSKTGAKLAESMVDLWQPVENQTSDEPTGGDQGRASDGLRCAAVLAGLQPEDQRWSHLASLFVAEWINTPTADFVQWRDLFFPVREFLFDAVMSQFRDEHLDRRTWLRAAETIKNYYSDRPELLVAAILDARPSQFNLIMPALAEHETAVNLLQEALAARPTKIAAPSRPIKPADDLKRSVGAAKGMITSRFAFCQAVSLDSFAELHVALRGDGFFIRRFRPWQIQDKRLVSAIWLRQNTPTQLKHGLRAVDLQDVDHEMSSNGWRPIDVSSYAGPDGSTQFAVIWKKGKRSAGERIEVYQHALPGEFTTIDPTSTNCIAALHANIVSGGDLVFSTVVRKLPISRNPDRWLAQVNLIPEAITQIADPVNFVVDVSVAGKQTRSSIRSGLEFQLQECRRRFEEAEGDEITRRATLFAEAYTLYKLNRFADCLEILDELIAQPGVAETWHYRYRALANARLGNKLAAQDDLHNYLAREGKPYLRTYVRTVVNECSDRSGVEELLAELEENSDDDILAFYGAIACAHAADVWRLADNNRFAFCRDMACRLWQKTRDRNMVEFALEDFPTLAALLADSLDSSQLPQMRLHSLMHSAIHLDQEIIVGSESEVISKARNLADGNCRPRSVASYSSENGAVRTIMTWDRPRPAARSRVHDSRRRANAALALMRLGKETSVLPFLRRGADNTLRNQIVTLAESTEIDVNLWWRIANKSDDPLVRFSALLACSAYPPIPNRDTQTQLEHLYRTHPDPGVHSAVRRLMDLWGFDGARKRLDNELASQDDAGPFRWYVSPHQITFSVAQGPVSVRMGSPAPELGRTPVSEILHRRLIHNSFAMSTTEITVGQFLKFRPDELLATVSPDVPITMISWYDAAAFCRWLSEQEGVAEAEMCYPPINEIGPGMSLPEDYSSRIGYRLPSEAEWEYMCRAGSITPWHCGADQQSLPHFAVYGGNTINGEVRAVAGKLPNDLGMFDMHGNAAEWCQNPIYIYNFTLGRRAWPDSEFTGSIAPSDTRAHRGGSFAMPPERIRSARRSDAQVETRTGGYGFRIVCTLRST